MKRNARGFTLIELAVVMLLLTIILAMVGLQTAQQEAILQGEVIGVEFNVAGYQFAKLNDKNEFQVLSQDEVLRAHQLPEGMILQNMESSDNTKSNNIVLMPSGELTAFTITFSRGKARWRVEGKANGEIKPTSPV